MGKCTVILEAHGKAVIAKGETRDIKDLLKAQGGRWNPKLTGWIFPGSKLETVKEALNADPRVGTVADQTGGKVAGAWDPAAAPAAATAKAKKATSDAPSAAAAAINLRPTLGEGEVAFAISDTIFATVNSFAGRRGVDIRKFYKDQSGELKHTAKGVRLGAPEWEALCQKFGSIDKAGNAEETKISIESDIVVTVSSDSVDIRKQYTDKNDGELKPTKKGCCLQRGEWKTLTGIAAQITEELGKSSSSSSSAPPKKKQRTKAEDGSAATSSTEKPVSDGANPSADHIRRTLAIILQGRDLSELTPKLARTELEAKLGLSDGALNERKDEIKQILVAMLES